jgi:hypothetical protein
VACCKYVVVNWVLRPAVNISFIVIGSINLAVSEVKLWENAQNPDVQNN